MTEVHRVILHVGTPKSGTTYLQDLMWANRELLAEAGVRYPGADPAAHFHAAVELAYGNFHGWTDPAVPGAWRRLVEDARNHRGTTVISHELFGDLSADAAARALSDLDFAEVHVVVTARDLARQLPAVWQEDVKNRHFLPYPRFLEAVRPGAARDVERPGSGRPEWHGQAFWLRQDVPAVLRRWGAGLPRSRVHLVTVPARGSMPDVLWERFARVVGIDPATTEPLVERRNTSMGDTGAELLRRLNERLDYSVDWPVYSLGLTHSLALTTLSRRATDGPLRLPSSERSWVSEWSERAMAQLRSFGFDVIGNLDDLRPEHPDTGASPSLPSAEDLLDLALDTLAALLRPVSDTPAPAPVPPLPAPAELEAPLEAQPLDEVPPMAAFPVESAIEPAAGRRQEMDVERDGQRPVQVDEGPTAPAADAPALRRSWRLAVPPRRQRGAEQLLGAARPAP